MMARHCHGVICAYKYVSWDSGAQSFISILQASASQQCIMQDTFLFVKQVVRHAMQLAWQPDLLEHGYSN